MTLTTQGQQLVDRALSPAYLASGAMYHLSSEQSDQTRWPNSSGKHCVGGFIALEAGFRQGADEHHAHTGDLWWDVCEALIPDAPTLDDGLSMFAPEATAVQLGDALWKVINTNADRVLAA